MSTSVERLGDLAKVTQECGRTGVQNQTKSRVNTGNTA